MNRCRRCEGFVPENATECPNCRSSGAWWMAPLAFAGAGLASVTLSACYGAPCVRNGVRAEPISTTVILLDGGTSAVWECNSDGGTIDCRSTLADGGLLANDPEFQFTCHPYTPPTSDGGADGG